MSHEGSMPSTQRLSVGQTQVEASDVRHPVRAAWRGLAGRRCGWRPRAADPAPGAERGGEPRRERGCQEGDGLLKWALPEARPVEV